MSATSRRTLIAYALATLVVALDQLSKAWVVSGLGLTRAASIEVWGPLRLTLVNNGGVSFGLLQSDSPIGRWGLTAFSLVVAIALAVWVRSVQRLPTVIAVGFIIGGAMGNVIDRVRFGTVVDFVDLQRLFFPWIFNVADSAISIGIAVLLLESMLLPGKAEA